MKRWISGVVVMVTALIAAKINLHDGRSIVTQKVEYDGAYLITDQDTIPREDIMEIIFEVESGREVIEVSVDGDVQALLDRATVSNQRYPDAKGILLVDVGERTLHDDGSRSYTYHMAYLILSESNKSYATFRHYLEEGDNEVRIHFARVIKPDGRVLELDRSTIRVESPPRGTVFFGKDKWVTFTLPGVQVGDIIEYSYENITFNPWNKDFLEGGYYFRGDDPYIYSKYTVDVPEDEYIKWKVYNDVADEVGFSEEIRDGRRIMVWLAEDMAPYVAEPYATDPGEYLTRVEFSNQPDWEAIHDWYAGFQNERLQVTPEVQALSDSLTRDAQSDDEKIAVIYYWVQTNVRYISIKGAAGSGVAGHRAAHTLEQGFGDCTDKANLFAAMLRAVGIDADPVYVGTNDDNPMLDPELPGYYGDHCITEVFLPDTSFYLDATGSSNGGFSRYPSFNSADHGVYAVNSQKRKVEIIPLPAPSQEQRDYNLDLEIDEEGTLFVHYQSFYVGNYETDLRYYWTYFTREEDRRIRFENMVKNESPDAELVSYELINVDDISRQLSLKITYRIPNYVKFAGPVAVFNLPEVGRRLSFDEVSLASREYPMQYYTSEAIAHHVALRLPESWQVDYLPEGLNLDIPEVSYQAAYSEEEGNLIRFEDYFSRPERIIPAESYLEYKETLNSITSFHAKPIIAVIEGGE